MESNLDAETARMRENNYEKFKSLVRMHLSFELDLNTDEFDHECHVLYEDKGRTKKWVSKKQKHATGLSGAICTSGDRSPPERICNMHLHLKEFKKFFLLEKNLTQEGIFRKTGSAVRQNELRSRLKSDRAIDLEENGFSVHDCATVFKGYLADLPEPLLTEAHYPAYSQLASLCTGGASTSQQPNSDRVKREQQVLNSLQLLLLLLPLENRNLLKEIIIILHSVVDYKDFNKMSAENLATLFSPHLICPRNMPPEALHYVAKKMSNVIAFMILHGVEIFEVPVKLATDIKVYFLERKRKTTMSPEALDDSISDISTVNTVYTFVDREKTAAAHITNTTDTELAQLYAHIQSLPESSKKRRLIKQFNKQNGQGTPLQFVVMNRLKSESSRSVKSFSNSIKKHIFQKGLIPRTPKRVPTASSTSRMLFQSPAVAGIAAVPHTDSDSDACSTPHNTSYKQLHRTPQTIASTPIHWNTALTPLTQQNVDIHDLLYSKQFQLNAHDAKSGTSSLKAISEATPHTKQSHDTDSISIDGLEQEVLTETESNSTSKTMTKSRFKSEPNLSCLLKERPVIPSTINELMTPTNKSGKSLTHKLIKGVSMNNLKLPFGTPETTKRLMRSVSSTLKLRPGHNSDSEPLMGGVSCESDENERHSDEPAMEDTSSLDTISSNSRSSETDVDSLSNTEAVQRRDSNRQSVLLAHNLNVITTSTPSWLLGRRSMSPITKSTQRMSKAMQESIMTPRSRKPVIMLTAPALASTDHHNHTAACDADSPAFAEKDEEVFLNKQQWLDGQEKNCDYQDSFADSNAEQNDVEQNALSSDFKEYLLSRSVLTASLVDSSFSSQSDDFGSTKELFCLDESQLSHSLLYCLDGNKPPKKNDTSLDSDTKSKLILAENQSRCSETGDSVNSNNARKRAASHKSTEVATHTANFDFDSKEEQENCNEHRAITKKLLIVNPIHPGETSL